MKEKKSKSKAAVSESVKKAKNQSRMSLLKGSSSSSNVKLPRSKKKKKEEKSKQKKKNKKTTVISALSANSTTSSSSSSASTAEPRSKATTKSRQQQQQHHSAVVLRHDDDHYSPTAHMKAMMADLGHRHSPQHQPETMSTLATSSVFSHPPPRCPKERADRRQRRTHARAKKLFRRDVFGADEEEFRATKLHHHLNTYFPSDVQLVPVEEGEGQSMRTTRANGGGNGNGSGPFSAASCGTCCCMKVFIVATLLISALMFLTDPCYPLKEYFLGPDTDAAEPKIIPIGARSQLSEEHFGTTFEPYSSSLPFFEQQQQQTTVFDNNNNSSRSKSFGKKGKKEEDKDRKRKASLHCPYKTFYIALLLSGVLLYLLICACYSLQIIVRCNFRSWFLLEAALLLLYSFTLVGASVGAFLVKGEAEATVLGLIDGLLGLLVALWNYGNWRAGLTPLESDLVDDPEQNVVARVIGSRQISRLFEFSQNGKEDVSGKEVDDNGNGKQQEPAVMVVILTDEKHD